MPSNDATSLIDRRAYLKAAGGLAAAGATGLAGCTDGGEADAGGSDDGSDGGSDSTGVLSTKVTDQPTDIDDFESCVVTLDGVWLGPRKDAEGGEEETDDEEADDEEETEDGDDEETQDGSDGTTNETTSESAVAGSQPEDAGQNQSDDEDDTEDGDEEESTDGDDEDAEEESEDGEEGDGNGRTYYAFDEPQEADLVELQGDNTQLVDDREVPVGTYQYLQLDVAGVEGVLVEGGEAVVETPGNAPLKFQESFDVKEGYRTSFTADFAPVRRGNGEYLIKPVATGTEVSYSPVGEADASDGESDDGDDEETTDDGGDETTDGSDDTSDDETTDGGDGGNETATNEE